MFISFDFLMRIVTRLNFNLGMTEDMVIDKNCQASLYKRPNF